MTAVGILAAAFEDDPVFARLFVHDRPAALTAWFEVVVEILDGCRRGSVRIDGAAAAAWTTGTCTRCLERLDDDLTALVRARAGAPGIDLTARVQAAAAPVDVPAWSLHWLGVAPAEQRGGHGGRLLDEVLAESHAAGQALSTTTPNPAAVPFYGRHGLAPLAVRAVAGTESLRFWTLLAPVPA
ncbi:MAG: GNAT family N-acetyltransferase [Sporichthyaceae bacterium]